MGSFYEPGQYEKEIARKVGILNRASKVRDKIRDFIDENIDEKALQAEVAEMQSKPVVEGLEKLGAKFDNQLGVDFDTAESSKSIINFLDSVKDELQLSLDPTHVVDIEDIKNHMKNAIAELKTLTDAIPRMSPTQLFALQDAPHGYTEHLFDLNEALEQSNMEIPELHQSIGDFASSVSAFKKTLNKFIPGAENIQYMMQQAPKVPKQTPKQTGSQFNDDDDNDTELPDTEDLEPNLNTDILKLRQLGLQIDNKTPQTQIKKILENAETSLEVIKDNIQQVKQGSTSSDTADLLDKLEEEKEKAEETIQIVQKYVKKGKSKTTLIKTEPKSPPPPPPKNTPVNTPVKIKKGTRSDASKKALAEDTLKSAPSSKLESELAKKVKSKKKTEAELAQEKEADAKAEESQRKQRDKLKEEARIKYDALVLEKQELEKLKESGKLKGSKISRLSALPQLIADAKTAMTGFGVRPRKRTARVAKTANGLTPKQFMELQQSGVDQSKLKVGTGSTTAPKNARGTRPYIITGQFFGNLKIDKSVLNEKLRVIAHDGAMKVMDRKIDFDTFDLLTKNFNSKKTYSKLAWDTYTALLALSDLSVVGKRGGVRVDKVRQAVADLRKKKLIGNGMKGCGIKLYKNRAELVNRKKVIQGCIGTGNNNPELKEELTEIDEILNGARAKK